LTSPETVIYYSMSKIKQITIHWAESNQVAENTVFKSLEEANQVLRRIGRDEGGKIGYCKVSYSTLFEDGEVYTGRIDVTEHDGHCFLEAMRDYVSFYLGKKKPRWMTEEQYQEVLKGADKVNDPEMIAWGERLGV